MIWLIGGTQEGLAIAHHLAQTRLPWLVTVTTSAGALPYRSLNGRIRVGPLTSLSLPQFLRAQPIDAIVDASHPFAVEISRLAMWVSGEMKIPYLRFERKRLPLLPGTEVLPNLVSVLHPRYLSNRRVLLTLGVKALALFQPWLTETQIWARILPNSWDRAIATGFPAQRLIPMRLPLTAEQEERLWLQLRIDTVIAKSSGVPGGLEVKQQVAVTLGAHLIVIERPQIHYPVQTDDLDTVVDFCTGNIP